MVHLSKMPKRKCVFSSNLQSKYPFLEATKINYEVHCNICKGTFSIAHGGNSDIVQHQKTSKHKLSLSAGASTSKIKTFFASKSFGKWKCFSFINCKTV